MRSDTDVGTAEGERPVGGAVQASDGTRFRWRLLLGPLAMTLTWRRVPRAERMAPFSALMAGLVWAAIALNLTTLHREGPLWAEVQPVYGLIQRSLFAAWFTWCAVVGLLVFRSTAPKPVNAGR